MISVEDAVRTCNEKWKGSVEAKPSYEGSSLNFYLNLMRSKLFNDCNHLTNGEFSLYTKLSPLLRVVVDVGVREDVYYIEASDPSTHLYMFEPHPVFFSKLQATVQEKGFYVSHPHLSLLNVGVSDKEGPLAYYEQAQSFVNRWQEQPSQHLPVVRLDSLPSLQAEPEISYLKIDTEGFELDVLRGAEGLLNKTKLIQFEYGGTYPHRGILLQDVVRYLEDHGFFYFYYIYETGLFCMDSQTIVEHEQYSNILASKFSL